MATRRAPVYPSYIVKSVLDSYFRRAMTVVAFSQSTSLSLYDTLIDHNDSDESIGIRL